MKILIVKRDKIGDLLLTTPLIAHLSQALPAARIHVLANDYNAWVVDGNRRIERVWVYRRTRHAGTVRIGAALEQARQFFALRAEHFDVAIAAGGEESPRAILRALAVRAKRCIAYVAGAAAYGRRLTDPLPAPAAGHETERMFGLLAPLGLAPPLSLPLPEFMLPPTWRDDGARWLREVGFAPGGFILLGLSARDAAKQPTCEQVLRWAARWHREYGCATALQFTPGDAGNALYPGSDALARSILAVAPDYVRPVPDGLAAAIGLFAWARTSVVPDSGLMHFAAASPGGVLGLFADPGRLSTPERWGPRGPRARALVAPQAIARVDDDAVFAALTPLLAGGDADPPHSAKNR